MGSTQRALVEPQRGVVCVAAAVRRTPPSSGSPGWRGRSPARRGRTAAHGRGCRARSRRSLSCWRGGRRWAARSAAAPRHRRRRPPAAHPRALRVAELAERVVRARAGDVVVAAVGHARGHVVGFAQHRDALVDAPGGDERGPCLSRASASLVVNRPASRAWRARPRSARRGRTGAGGTRSRRAGPAAGRAGCRRPTRARRAPPAQVTGPAPQVLPLLVQVVEGMREARARRSPDSSAASPASTAGRPTPVLDARERAPRQAAHGGGGAAGQQQVTRTRPRRAPAIAADLRAVAEHGDEREVEVWTVGRRCSAPRGSH